MISLVVPRDNGYDRVPQWQWCERRWREFHPDFEIIEGYCSGPWSKGVAVADGLSRASGDVIVMADADSWCQASVMCQAVELAREHPWIVPHSKVERLTKESTTRMLAGPVIDMPRGLRALRHDAVVGGGILVARREVLDAVPLDPRFILWGGDDCSWGRALDTLAGPHVCLDASLWHLDHPPSANRRAALAETEALAGRYLDAAGDPVAMRSLVDEALRFCHLT